MQGQSQGLRFNRQAAVNAIAETISDGEFFADIFENKNIQPPVFHYIITRCDSNEVLDWGQGFSLENMRRQANDWLIQEALRIAS